MKRVTVTFAEAKKRMNGEVKTSFVQKAARCLYIRRPRGLFARNLAASVKLGRKRRSEETSSFMKYSVAAFFFGGKLTEKLFPKTASKSENFSTKMIDYAVPYDSGKPLFHFAPEEAIEEIKKKGLVTEKKYVFTAKCPEELVDYLSWKTEKLGRDTTFVLLKIDAARAAANNKFIYYNPNEIVTGYIPPEYILFE